MGHIYADITLKNATDVVNQRRGIMQEPEIRQITVEAMVDTGAATLIINETLRQMLGLEVWKEHIVTLANDIKETAKITEPVIIQWKDREMTCQPWVVSNGEDVLLGVIPLENMDLIVDPLQQTLVGAHGEKPVGMLKGNIKRVYN
jgi:clan AA aspartic protease